MILAAICCVQLLCTFDVEGEGPVRFGVPVPFTVLDRGMRFEGSRDARMQWAPLTEAPPSTGTRLWVEVAVVGHSGRARLWLGGPGPVDLAKGPVVEVLDENIEGERGPTIRRSWRWSDGSIDWRERTQLLDPDDEREAGEMVTVESDSLSARRARVRIPALFWRGAGVLPPADGSGRDLRRELQRIVAELPRAPGSRGRGDYLRGPSGSTVTNGEFDTALAFARLGFATEDAALQGRARECAWHLVDVDLDRRSGLPFRHGTDHRSAAPEIGHVWVQGPLLVAATCADRDLFGDVLSIASSLALRVRAAERREGVADRLRDEAWPLAELEATLTFVDLAPLREAADCLVERIRARFDPALCTYRYGEGETRAGQVVRDRLWLTAGLLLPALEAHLGRRSDTSLRREIDLVKRSVVAILLNGQQGIPTQVMRSDTGPFGAARTEGEPEGCLLLEGLSEGTRRRVLARSGVRSALDSIFAGSPDDLATRFSIVGRCNWVMR